MSKDWRSGSSTSIAGFIGVLTAHNHHGESTYQNLMGGNVQDRDSNCCQSSTDCSDEA